MVPIRLLSAVSGLSLAVGVAACAPAAPPPAAPAAAAPTTPPAAAALTKPAAGQVTSDTYIPVISKGFQHQFWQAVKLGSEQAATALNVKITFEGPENETQVDKQIEMLQAALDKKPSAICLAALDSKAVVPLLEKAQTAKIPIIGFDSGVDGGQDGRADRRLR
jgi:ribose transport system substrate-binding protein